MYGNRGAHNNHHSSRYHDNNSPKHEKHSFGYQEDDDEDVDTIIQKTKSKRNETVAVTRDALSRLRQTEDTAMSSMEKLNQQSDLLRKAKTDLDLTKAHQDVANEQVGELKRLHKWIPIANPFKKKNASKKLRDAKLKADYEERIKEETETRRDKAASDKRLNDIKRGKGSSSGEGKYSSSAKYNSDLLDEEDRNAEAEIDENLDEIGAMTSRLKQMAMGMTAEIDSQNKLVDKLGKNADDMNVRVQSANMKMKRWE